MSNSKAPPDTAVEVICLPHFGGHLTWVGHHSFVTPMASRSASPRGAT